MCLQENAKTLDSTNTFKNLLFKILLFCAAFVAGILLWAELSSVDRKDDAADKNQKVTCHPCQPESRPETKNVLRTV